MNRTATAVAISAAVAAPMLTALPAQAAAPIKPQVGTCKQRGGGQVDLASGSYRVTSDGKIEYILTGMRGQADVEADVFRTTKAKGGALAVDWQIGEHRPIPAHPRVYRPNKSRSTASRGMGAPVVKVTVHRGWRGAWSCTFALRLTRDDRPANRR